MKKALLAVLSVVIAFTAMQPSQAQDQKVLAVIDTAINSNNFSSIIHEVCFTTDSCPNGTGFMEGRGSATATGWVMDKPGAAGKKVSLVSAWPKSFNSDTYHGDSMVKAALATDPNIKIVFIRVADIDALGNPLNRPQSMISAINWLSVNGSKYSVDAVSISQSGVETNIRTKTKTIHPECRNASATASVAALGSINVPVFAATGNDGLNTLVGFPACIPGVIGVGALGNATQLERATNTGLGLDMVTISSISVTKYNGSATSISGTSAATAISASRYVGKNTFSNFAGYLGALPKIVVSGVSYPSSPRG